MYHRRKQGKYFPCTQMKLMLFLGAGTSIPTQLPTVEEITNKIFDCDWHYHNRNFVRRFDSMGQLQVHRQQEFLKLLKSGYDTYLTRRRVGTANYEDLYSLCRQIEDDLGGAVHNVAINLFIEQIRKQTESLWKSIDDGPNSGLQYLAEEACRFIHCAVWQLLRTDKTPEGLDTITDLARFDIIGHLRKLLLHGEEA